MHFHLRREAQNLLASVCVRKGISLAFVCLRSDPVYDF